MDRSKGWTGRVALGRWAAGMQRERLWVDGQRMSSTGLKNRRPTARLEERHTNGLGGDRARGGTSIRRHAAWKGRRRWGGQRGGCWVDGKAVLFEGPKKGAVWRGLGGRTGGKGREHGRWRGGMASTRGVGGAVAAVGGDGKEAAGRCVQALQRSTTPCPAAKRRVTAGLETHQECLVRRGGTILNAPVHTRGGARGPKHGDGSS